MIWADRVALVFALICLPVIVFNENPHGAFNVSLVLALILWFVLRAVDFIFAGSVRTRSS